MGLKQEVHQLKEYSLVETHGIQALMIVNVNRAFQLVKHADQNKSFPTHCVSINQLLCISFMFEVVHVYGSPSELSFYPHN